MSELLYHRRMFIDFDEFSATVRDWDLEIFQLESGEFTSSIEQLSTGNVAISTAQFGGHTHQTGTPNPDRRMFALVADNATHVSWRKHSIGENSLMICPIGGEIDVTTPKGMTNIITLSINDKLLVKLMTEQVAEFFLHTISNKEVITMPKGVLQQIRGMCRGYFHLARKLPESIHSTLFEEEISKNLAAKITEVLPRRKIQQRKRGIEHDIWRRIDERIASPVGHMIKIKELCLAVQISERTLRRYFHKRFGTSPKQYLNLIRLNKVRVDLKRTAERKGIVSDIANKWGFWHMGQFAQDYYRLFGELPSVTLMK